MADDRKYNLYAAIMAGGSGTRFWPLSRDAHPKQALRIFGGKALLTKTVERLAGLVPQERIFVVATAAVQQSLAEPLESVPRARFVVEPTGRNTAPALAVAARLAKLDGPDSVVAALPADHLIQNEELFRRALAAAAELAAVKRMVVTFGIPPSRPETGFGYIEPAVPGIEAGPFTAHPVERFHEKPDPEQAQKYLASGNFYWNSGIFVFHGGAFLELVQKHLPELYAAVSSITVDDAADPARLASRLEQFYGNLESISVDVGIAQRTRKMAVIPVDFGWHDVGSFGALPEILGDDENANVILELDGAKIVPIDSRENILVGDKQLLVTAGVKGLIVVATKDAVLVLDKAQAAKLGEIVKLLKEDPELEGHF